MLTEIKDIKELPDGVRRVPVKDRADAERYMTYYGYERGWWLNGNFWVRVNAWNILKERVQK